VHLGDIAHNARDVDFAIRWGFGWQRGPFELWQAAGWQRVAQWIAEDIAAGKTMAKAPLPKWVTDGRQGVHGPEGSYSAETGKAMPRPKLPVYARQLFPETVVGEKPADRGTTVFEDDGVRMWHQGDRIAIVSFKSKMHSCGVEVLLGLNRAIDEAERNFDALVIWHEAPFAVGANLKAALESLKAGQFDEFEKMVALFQQTSQRLKYSLVPTVAAVEGMALGGGCEFVMHSQRAVAALESYIGLVEVGVGLLPAGGGLKEMAERAQAWAKGGDAFPEISRVFKQAAMGEVSKSAENAREMGYLKPADVVIFHPGELLYVAKQQARAMADAGVRPALAPAQIAVAGDTGIATLKMMLVNMKEGGFISDHDYEISSRIAEMLCGGEVEPAVWSTRSGCSTSSAAFRRAREDAEDPGAHRAHVEDRQAAEELEENRSCRAALSRVCSRSLSASCGGPRARAHGMGLRAMDPAGQGHEAAMWLLQGSPWQLPWITSASSPSSRSIRSPPPSSASWPCSTPCRSRAARAFISVRSAKAMTARARSPSRAWSSAPAGPWKAPSSSTKRRSPARNTRCGFARRSRPAAMGTKPSRPRSRARASTA
jgi:enoyl-CoA hydratase/carnithine racemase